VCGQRNCPTTGLQIELTGGGGDERAGNEKLSAGLSAEAIELYNKAIALNPSNAVYYGNRCVA
jgi:hypothetical protein